MTEAHSEGGYTLIEVLLAIAILGTTVVAVLAGMATGIITAGTHRDQSDAGTVLVRAAEAVKAAPYDTSCNAANTRTAYQNAAQGAFTTPPANWTAASISIPALDTEVTPVAGNPLYWDGNQFQATCNDANALSRLQQVKITVTSPNGRAKQSIYVVKRG